MVKGIKKLVSDELDRLRFEINEITQLKQLNIEKLRTDEEKRLEPIKTKKSDLSKIRDVKPKIEAIVKSINKKEQLLKTIIKDIVKDWKKLNEIVNPDLTDEITRETDPPSKVKDNLDSTRGKAGLKGKGKEKPKEEKVKKDEKPDKKNKDVLAANLAKAAPKLEYKGSIKVEKSEEDLENFYKEKIQGFKNTVLRNTYQFDIKADYQIDKKWKVLLKKKHGQDNEIKIYETGVVEFIFEGLTSYKVSDM